VTGPRDLELGVELGTAAGGEGVIVDRQVRGRLDPRAQGLVGGQAGGLPESMRNGGQHVRGQQEGLTSWDIQRQHGLQAARFIACEPVADGMAMDAQQAGHVLAGLGVPTGEHLEHVEPSFLATCMFMW
jgi:hypothetical protein